MIQNKVQTYTILTSSTVTQWKISQMTLIGVPQTFTEPIEHSLWLYA